MFQKNVFDTIALSESVCDKNQKVSRYKNNHIDSLSIDNDTLCFYSDIAGFDACQYSEDTMKSTNANYMWRLAQVEEAIGYKKSTIWQRVKDGLLPPPVRIGPGAVRWPSNEIHRIVAAQIAGQSQDVIAALVRQLVQDRQRGQWC